MIFGRLPLRHIKIERLQPYLTNQLRKENINLKTLFVKIFGHPNYSGIDNEGNCSFDSVGFEWLQEHEVEMRENSQLITSFIDGLLQFDPSERLTGVVQSLSASSDPLSPTYTAFPDPDIPPENHVPTEQCVKQRSTSINIKEHDFFRGIDWELLGRKELSPPEVLPRLKSITMSQYSKTGWHLTDGFQSKAPDGSIPVPSSLQSILINSGRKAWLTEEELEKANNNEVSTTGWLGWGSGKQTKQTTPNQESSSSEREYYHVSEKLQEMFSKWYFIAPRVVEEECVLCSQLELLEKGNIV